MPFAKRIFGRALGAFIWFPVAAVAGGFAGIGERVSFTVWQTTSNAAMHTVRTTPFTRHEMTEFCTLDLDAAEPAQRFSGIGVSFTDGSCWLLSQMPAADRKALLEDLFTDRGLGLSIGRLNEGSSDYATELYNYNDHPGDVEMRHFSVARDEKYMIPVLKEALAVRPDLFLFSSPWSPPGWMKTSGRMCGGALRDDCLEALANYHVAYFKAYRDLGITIRAMTNQNEPGTDQAGGCPATLISAEQEATIVGRLLPPKLKAAGLDVETWLWDHNHTSQEVSRVIATLADKDVARVTKSVAVHPYGGHPSELRRIFAARPDAVLHLTEHGLAIQSRGTTEVYWLKEMLDYFNAGCSSYSAWNLCLDADGQPCTGHFPCGGLVEVTPGVPGWIPSKQYAAFRHVGPFVKPGARVLKLPPAAFKDVAYAAFRNPDGSLVLVLTHTDEHLYRRPVQIKCRGEWLQLALPLETWSLTTVVIPPAKLTGMRGGPASALPAGTVKTALSAWEFRREGGAWTQVAVPHDWAIAGPFDKENDKQVVAIRENGEKSVSEKTGRTGALPWIGRGEYRTTIDVPAGTGHAALVFDGAMSEPRVYCDGKLVGEWKNGYNAFEVALPTKPGRHEIRVTLENMPESSRWYPGAGLIRPVTLVLGGRDGVKTWGNAVWSPDLKTVCVKTECRGNVARVVHRLLDGQREVAVSDKGELKGNFRPWSPEDPYLYTLVTEAYAPDGTRVDRVTERIGVRTLAYARGEFRLNGKPRRFKGVCLHHDLGPLGAVFDRDAYRRQLVLLKEMGCDAIRTSHNMPAEGQLELCDELGFLVMAESFDSWAEAKCKNGYNRFFSDWWRRDIENLVRKCRNHPSVAMWSIGNEVGEQDKASALTVLRAMQAHCHRFDPDPKRLVTQGLSWMPYALNSGWNAAMEIPAVTYRLPFYEAMYTNSPAGFVLGAETASTLSSRGVYHFPVVPTEDKPFPDGQCSGYDVECCNWSNLPDDDWAVHDRCPWVIGEFVWTGFDYLGEPWPYDDLWPSRSAYFGIFDLAGLPKDRYWLYRSRWNASSHTLHLMPHWTFPDRVGKVTPVQCYTDFDEAELFLNGVSQGRRRKDPSARLSRYRLWWKDVVYAPGELKVVAYGKDGKIAMTETVRTAGKPARVELAKRRFGRLLFVTASIVDEKGTLVPDADSELVFTCGAGLRFKAICNGDATSVESFVQPRMRTFHGQLVAIFEGVGDDVTVRGL